MTDTPPTQTVAVFEGRMFAVIHGVAEGESISFADELVMDDVYHLSGGATRQGLALSAHPDNVGFVIAPGSAVGVVGNQVVLDCCITLMAPDSRTFEAVVLVEVEADGVEAIYLLPLATLQPHADYRLVGVDRHAATKRFAEVAYVSFTRGTHITLASGKQVPIEDMRVGDMVLTRDDGQQAVRWIGQSTIRATGDFAPIVIKKGALHNENDLILSPDHRLFVYQRQDRLGAGRSEVLVKVRHLVNGSTVFQQNGGFVDYYQLLFDEHQIIYAEGIAAESLLIDPRTWSALPAEAGLTKSHGHRQHLDYEIKEQLLAMPDAVELLRKASSS